MRYYNHVVRFPRPIFQIWLQLDNVPHTYKPFSLLMSLWMYSKILFFFFFLSAGSVAEIV